MHCGEFEDRIQQLLDERRPPADDAALAAHADVCSDCSELLAAYLQATETLTSPPSSTCADVAAEQVIAAWRAPAIRSRRRVLAPALALAAVAAILVAVIPAMWPRGDARLAPTPIGTKVIADAADAPHHGASHASAAPLTDVSREAGAAYRALIDDSQQSLAAAWQVVPTGAAGETAPESASSSDLGVADQLAQSLSPVARSAGDSLAALFSFENGDANQPTSHQRTGL